jgi:hypothetical protein
MSPRIFIVVALLIASAWPYSANGYYDDTFCREHKADAEIDAKSKDLALELLAGQPTFISHWNEYLKVLKAGPHAVRNETELAIDLHWKDPQDVQIWTSTDGLFHYTIDPWRVVATQALVDLATSKDIPATMAKVQYDISAVSKEAAGLFIADFNHSSDLGKLPFIAQKKADGGIEIVKKP